MITKLTNDLAAAQRELRASLAKHEVGTITSDDIARHGADILFAVNDDETGGFSYRKVGEVEGREATKRLTKKIELRALEYEAHAAGRVISAARREFGDVPTWSAVKSKELSIRTSGDLDNPLPCHHRQTFLSGVSHKHK